MPSVSPSNQNGAVPSKIQLCICLCIIVLGLSSSYDVYNQNGVKNYGLKRDASDDGNSSNSSLILLFIPFIIAAVVFCASLILWRCLKTKWLHSIIVSFANGAIILIIIRKIQPHPCEYEYDAFAFTEAAIFIVALISVVVLMHYDACKANKRNQCLMCCRIKKT